jgi:hypothetical protein
VLLIPVALWGLASARPADAATPWDAAVRAEGSSDATTEVVTTPAAEAWYRPTSPTCGLPVGCPPVAPPSTYPEGTLHVGVLAGQEEARTYVALAVPADATLVGGSLRLPVGPSEDGTTQPEGAQLRACLVTGTVKDKVSGDVAKPPTADCSVASPAVATQGPGGTVFTVDLAPFVVQWTGERTGALVLLPTEAPAQTDVWHVAFSRHDRPVTTGLRLSATLLVEAERAAPAAPPTGPTPAVALPPITPAAPPLLPGIAPAPVGELPPVSEPAVSPPRSIRQAASLTPDDTFAYPGVFLLPPLMLIAAGWAARAFTRDLAEEQR